MVINGNSTFGTLGTGCRAAVGSAGRLSVLLSCFFVLNMYFISDFSLFMPLVHCCPGTATSVSNIACELLWLGEKTCIENVLKSA